MKIDYEILKPAINAAKSSENGLKMVCGLSLKSSVIKECLNVVYKDHPAIETLPTEEKKWFWEYACKEFPNLTKEDKIQLSKNLYTLGLLF